MKNFFGDLSSDPYDAIDRDKGGTPAETTQLRSKLDVHLLRNSKGTVVFNHHNAMEILEKYEEWQGVLAFDEFAQRKMLMKPIPGASGNPSFFRPREIRDTDYIRVLKWFNKDGFLSASKNTICDVVDDACMSTIISPVKHWLEQLPEKHLASGDGHLDTWLFTMMGVKPQSEDHRQYVSQVGRKWIMSAVARAVNPGCKADGVLILEGTQGAGKSTALRELAGEDWFGDALPSMASKDASDYVRGKWIIELAELSNINKAEVEIVKAFISRAEERFRPAYGRSEILYPRACVFAGTTNKSDYLRDETGNRRFWPVKCGTIDVKAIRENRLALFAEAVRAVQSGENWWLDSHAEQFSKLEQERRLSVDEWAGLIETHCEGKIEVAISTIADEALGIQMKDINRQTQNRISAVLAMIGFERDGVFYRGDLRNKARFVRV